MPNRNFDPGEGETDPQDNNLSHRLLREVEVLGCGSLQGIFQAAIENPGTNTANFLGSLSLGLALNTNKLRYLPIPQAAKGLTATAMTTWGMIDLRDKLSTVSTAAQRTWRSDAQVESDKETIGRSLGRYIFDSALSSGSSLYGFKMGRLKHFEGGPLLPTGKETALKTFSPLSPLEPKAYRLYHPQDPIFQNYKKAEHSVGIIESFQGNKQLGTGTGFIIHKDGYLGTAHHVIENSDSVFVRFQNGEHFPLDKVAANTERDTALLKIRANKEFPALELGNSDAIKPLEKIFTLGHPHTWKELHVSAGSIREKGMLESHVIESTLPAEMWLTDGFSGSPWFNARGKVIGISHGISVADSKRYGFSSMSFAAKTNTLKELLESATQVAKL